MSSSSQPKILGSGFFVEGLGVGWCDGGCAVPAKVADDRLIFSFPYGVPGEGGSDGPPRGMDPATVFGVYTVVCTLPTDAAYATGETNTAGEGRGSENSIVPMGVRTDITRDGELPTYFFFSNFTRLCVTDTTPKEPGVVGVGSPRGCLITSTLGYTVFTRSTDYTGGVFYPPSAVYPTASVIPPATIYRGNVWGA